VSFLTKNAIKISINIIEEVTTIAAIVPGVMGHLPQSLGHVLQSSPSLSSQELSPQAKTI